MADTTSPTDAVTAPSVPQTTRVGRQWLVKTLFFLVLLLSFGTWGLVDAVYFYPKRGAADASFQLREHLVAAQRAGRLTPASLEVPDPSARLAELKAKEAELRRTAEVSDDFSKRQAQVDLTRLVWLESLSQMWDLDTDPKLVLKTGSPAVRYYYQPASGTAYTVGADGARADITLTTLHDELNRHWTSATRVAPLAWYDMAVQWAFVVIGYGGGLWLLVSMLRTFARTYRWEPAHQRLTLPGGATVVPADLKDVDKRLWHKYYVTLNLKDGRSHTLDLYRYVPLEDWVLTLERAAFPEAQDGPAEPAASPEPHPENPEPSYPNT